MENGGVTCFLVKQAVIVENESNWLRIYPMAGFFIGAKPSVFISRVSLVFLNSAF
jgi:hypothetical protein